jgi:hypothetical protein
MTLLGHVKNGTIVFDPPVVLPEGAAVQVEVVAASDEKASTIPRQTLLERLGNVVGSIDDLPEDMARNHDHYLYGTPKKS